MVEEYYSINILVMEKRAIFQSRAQTPTAAEGLSKYDLHSFN